MKQKHFESLVSTMGENGRELYDKMNIQSDAIIINQQKYYFYNEQQIKDNSLKEYGFKEYGVGLSRNNALMRSEADICLMADDDMVYVDNYLEIIEKEYERNPDADMILFNVRIHDDNGVTERVKRNGRVNFLNSLKYGTVSFTFKREKVIKKNILFSLLFGGGATFSNGEDSIFLWDCLKEGIKVYSSTEIIADVYNFESSWFEGYNNKFFIDRGALFEALSSTFSLLLIFQYVIRKHTQFPKEYSNKRVLRLMIEGREKYREM